MASFQPRAAQRCWCEPALRSTSWLRVIRDIEFIGDPHAGEFEDRMSGMDYGRVSVAGHDSISQHGIRVSGITFSKCGSQLWNIQNFTSARSI